VIRANAARMNGTARVSRAKISPRSERSRNATAPTIAASTPLSSPPSRMARKRLPPCRP
jgi:hypothetical protein